MSEHQRSLLKPAIYHHTPPASSFSTYTPTPSSSDHQHSQTTKAPHKDHPKYTSAPTNHKTIHHRPRDRQLPNSKKNSEAKTLPLKNPTKIAKRQRRKRARWKAEALLLRSARQTGNQSSFAELETTRAMHGTRVSAAGACSGEEEHGGVLS
jgi:hypothetical protein